MNRAMNSILPILVAASAVLHAQPPSQNAPAVDRYTVNLDKYEVVRDGDDFDGVALGAKILVAENLRASIAYADASSDAFDLTTGVGGVNLELDASRLSLGLEYDLALKPGVVSFSLAYAQVTAEASGGATGDVFENNQVVLGARYEMALGHGFSLGLSAQHFLGDLKVEPGFSTLAARNAAVARYDGSPTSVGLSLSYDLSRHLNFHLTYATEDSLLGLANADNTISFGVKARF